MPGSTDSGEGGAFTRSERALEAVLATSHADGKDACAAFWGAWQERGVNPPRTIADFRAACDQPDGAAGLLQLCSDLVTGAKNADLRKSAKKPLVDLVKALLLAASERYLGAAAVVTEPAGGSILAVHVNDPTTAGLVAAGRSGSGARLVSHPSTGRPVIQNLLHDSPAMAYTGKENADADAWGAELHEWASTALEAPERWTDPPNLRTRIGADPRVVGPQFVRMQLARVEREQHTRPLIAFSARPPATVDHNAGLLAKLNAEFGEVHAFVHDAGSAAAQARAARELESTVQDYVSAIFVALDPAFVGRPATLPPPAGRKKVFISYAHVDGGDWLVKVQLHLAGLDAVDTWSDKRLETGNDWLAEIQGALADAACAVLILTPGFLASKFIKGEEVPALLQRLAGSPRALTLLPILAGACAVDAHPWLDALQIQCKSVPLEKQGDNVNTELMKLTQQVRKLLAP